MNIDPRWHQKEIENYKSEHPRYQIYAKVLQDVLEAVCRQHAPEAIVQSRAKALSSFAEKAIRRSDKYQSPSTQLTDLCGARVICNSFEEIERICAFIERHFEIDEENSEGRKPRQKTEEFGYASFHYIVQIKADEILGVEIPKDQIGERKAEIQVRTLLQHAWANISHDQFYKNQFRPPEKLERSMARLSALLEEADEAFSLVIGGLNTYKLNYGTYMGKRKIGDEIQTLKTILQNEPVKENKPLIALKIARLAKATSDWKMIVDELNPYLTEKSRAQVEILCEHGYALCRDHRDATLSEEYTKGQEELKHVTGLKDEKTYVQALLYLGWSYRNEKGKERKARECYRDAYETEPLNPYVSASYLEYEIFCGMDPKFLPLIRNALTTAVKTCRDYIDAGIELPWAYLTMGRFQLFLREYYESLGAYAKAIHLCSDPDTCVKEDIFDEELEFLNRINLGKDLPAEHKWVENLLLLGKSLIFHKDQVLQEIRERSKRKKPFVEPVVIVAGGTDPSVEKDMQQYKGILSKAFDGYTGTVISGGTRAGIPGVVGSVREKLRQEGKESLIAIGYLPAAIPEGVKPDERYDEPIYTEGGEFSPHQLLQNWIDLAASGVRPENVLVFGVNGGNIAALEYRLALAFGATVGLIQSSGRAVKELIPDTSWWNTGRLVWLPNDKTSIRAFLNPGKPSMSQDKMAQIGQIVHETFLKDNRYKSLDPVMMPWSLLREDIKRSNIEQAGYLEEILRSFGYGVRPLTGKNAVAQFAPDEVEKMAEMEHGRWNVERLKSGWKYAPIKDTARKISPYLVPWEDLTETVKGYDRDNVNNWPEILSRVGLEIYRL